MRRKLMGVALGAIVAVSGFAVAGLGSGTAATSRHHDGHDHRHDRHARPAARPATTTAAPPSTGDGDGHRDCDEPRHDDVTDTETVFLTPRSRSAIASARASVITGCRSRSRRRP